MQYECSVEYVTSIHPHHPLSTSSETFLHRYLQRFLLTFLSIQSTLSLELYSVRSFFGTLFSPLFLCNSIHFRALFKLVKSELFWCLLSVRIVVALHLEDWTESGAILPSRHLRYPSTWYQRLNSTSMPIPGWIAVNFIKSLSPPYSSLRSSRTWTRWWNLVLKLINFCDSPHSGIKSWYWFTLANLGLWMKAMPGPMYSAKYGRGRNILEFEAPCCNTISCSRLRFDDVSYVGSLVPSVEDMFGKR